MKRLLFGTCVALGSLSLASCINDYDTVLDAFDTNLTMVTFQVSTNSNVATRADGVVHGTDDTNHNEDGIEDTDASSAECNYAYIYGTDDNYLGKLQNLELKQNSGDAADYTCTGQTALMLPTDFKIVFLGNYDSNSHTGVNNDEDAHQILLDTFMEPTTGSKLEELWSPTSSESTSCPRFNGGISPGEYSDYYIPFYGVHLFNDVILEEDEYKVVLDEPITLIRSIAKMEVNMQGMENFSLDGYEYTSITATVHNAAGIGYTAPKDVTSQDDYDGVATMNPYTDDNSNTASWEGYETTYTTEDGAEAILSEFYLCEQDNSDVGEVDIPYIALTVTATNKADDKTARYTYAIYFASYNENEVDKTNPWNIQRNHLYSFNVTFEGGKIIIVCYDWNLNFENNTSNFNPNNYYIEIEDGIDWEEYFEDSTTPVIDTEFDYDEFLYVETEDGIDWEEHFENNSTTTITTEKSE